MLKAQILAVYCEQFVVAVAKHGTRCVKPVTCYVKPVTRYVKPVTRYVKPVTRYVKLISPFSRQMFNSAAKATLVTM